jgi:hypothetical protein
MSAPRRAYRMFITNEWMDSASGVDRGAAIYDPILA